MRLPFGINLKRDGNKLIAGGIAALALMVVPGVSTFIFEKVIVPIRGMLNRGKGGEA